MIKKLRIWLGNIFISNYKSTIPQEPTVSKRLPRELPEKFKVSLSKRALDRLKNK